MAAERFLGFDFGTRYIGVATGESLTGSSQPLITLQVRREAPPWDEIRNLLDKWQPAALVVGLPLARDGGEQPMSGRARRFARQLQDHFEYPVHLFDERHTSREAARRFAEARNRGSQRRRHAAQLDAMAAAVILENWLALHPQTPEPPHA